MYQQNLQIKRSNKIKIGSGGLIFSAQNYLYNKITAASQSGTSPIWPDWGLALKSR